MRTGRRGTEHEGVEHGVPSRDRTDLPGKRPGRCLLSRGRGGLPGRFRDHEERDRLSEHRALPIETTRWSTSRTGLKRVVVRDSKIERIEANNAFRAGEKFQARPAAGRACRLMPKDVVSVEAGPWDDRGRRPFRYVGSRLNKPIRMEQAIIEIGPHVVKLSRSRRFLGGRGRDRPGPALGGHQPARSSRAEERQRARAGGPVS